MNAPLIICNGLIRSGSTWSFNVCRGILPAARSCYFSKEQLDAFIKNDWKRTIEPTVVKAHELGPAALASLFSGRSRAVCTVRDPRDCVASDLTFLGRDFDYVLGRISYSFEFLRHYLSNDNVLMVRYEQMMANPPGEIRRIALHLGAAIDDAAVNLIDSKTNLAAAKRVCEQLVDQPAEKVLSMDSHWVDALTQLHENHIFSGKTGRWKEELSAEQIMRVNEVFGEWLGKLGYQAGETGDTGDTGVAASADISGR